MLHIAGAGVVLIPPYAEPVPCFDLFECREPRAGFKALHEGVLCLALVEVLINFRIREPIRVQGAARAEFYAPRGGGSSVTALSRICRGTHRFQRECVDIAEGVFGEGMSVCMRWFLGMS